MRDCRRRYPGLCVARWRAHTNREREREREREITQQQHINAQRCCLALHKGLGGQFLVVSGQGKSGGWGGRQRECIKLCGAQLPAARRWPGTGWQKGRFCVAQCFFNAYQWSPTINNPRVPILVAVVIQHCTRDTVDASAGRLRYPW